jgi:hypothetical protein
MTGASWKNIRVKGALRRSASAWSYTERVCKNLEGDKAC